MAETYDDSENVRPNGQRPSNNDMLVRLTVQMEQVLEISRTTQTRVEQAMSRIESTDRELAAQRTRLDALDARTAGISADSIGQMRGLVKEHGSRLDVMRDDAHKLRGRVQVELLKAPLFTRDEATEIRGYLGLARKHQVDDAFMPEEMEVLHEVITEQRRWRERLKERQTEASLIRVNLQSAKPGHILTAIAVTVAVLGFLMLYVVPHVRFH